MNKRDFLTTAALAAALPGTALAKVSPHAGHVLLTLTGAIGKGNRGPLDPALDQLMKKHGVKFDKAHTFDAAALDALPAVTIRPTLEYDAKVHVLHGPLLADVVSATGAPLGENNKLLLRAIDGYAATVTAAEARKYRFIIATRLDGKPLPLGGLGPCWSVYEADRFPDMAARPLNERFGACPWGVYHIEVQ